MTLLSTDFDGTLIGFQEQTIASPNLCEALVAFKQKGGIWAINTGRPLDHILLGLQQLQVPITPDFLLTTEREIYYRNHLGQWLDLEDWNHHAKNDHANLFENCASFFEDLRFFVQSKKGIQIVADEATGQPCGIITENESIMNDVVENIQFFAKNISKFSFQRNYIYLRFCHSDYHKGAALEKVGNHLNISHDHRLAIGDQHNDISMLDGRFASKVACPSNAIEEVKNTVRQASGFIASKTYGEGVAEAMRHYQLC